MIFFTMPMIALYAVCAGCAFWNPRAMVFFVICLTLARWITISDIPFLNVWFFAIYAGIGALVFFMADTIAGALLLLAGLPSAFHASELVSTEFRDFAGESLFVVGAFLAAYLGPTDPNSIRSVFSSGRFGNITVFRNSGVDRTVKAGVQKSRKVRVL